jgi:outer membrane immunogenic protein
MKKLIIAAAAISFAGAAQAADLYVKAPAAAYDWSGIYVGANGGGGWTDTTWNFETNGFLDTYPKGATAGGQVGINRQLGNWVWSAELTGNWADLSASDSLDGLTVTTKLHDLETLTGRLGYAFNNVLVYAKSGGATGVVGVSGVTLGGDTFSQKQRLYGGTAGGGIEYALTPNWIVGVEYDYTRLFAGQFNSVSRLGNPTPFGSADVFLVQSALGRVSYKF